MGLGGVPARGLSTEPQRVLSMYRLSRSLKLKRTKGPAARPPYPEPPYAKSMRCCCVVDATLPYMYMHMYMCM